MLLLLYIGELCVATWAAERAGKASAETVGGDGDDGEGEERRMHVGRYLCSIIATFQ